MTIIETRDLFESGLIKVVGEMHGDDTEPNYPDFQDDSERRDYMARYQRGDFRYVGMVVRVEVDGFTAGEDSLWGIEHGTVGENVEADAWELTPAQYGNDDDGRAWTIGGSSLVSVVTEAIERTRSLARTLEQQRHALDAAEKKFDPNAR